MSRARNIISELRKARVDFRGTSGSRNIMIPCPHPEHNETVPSCAINARNGEYYCYGCGRKGQWAVLQTLLNVSGLPGDMDLDDPYSTLGLCDLKKGAEIRYHIPWNVEPWTGKYRHLKEGFVRKVGGVYWHDPVSWCPRIFLPCYQQDEMVGWVARRLDDKKDMKYRNALRLKAGKILYPYATVQDMALDYVVVVEGPYDALRLIQMGIPALAVLGAKNWSRVKVALLQSLCPRFVVLCFDADVAGRKAAAAIKADLESHTTVYCAFPPEGYDPGNVDKNYLFRLRAQCERRVARLAASTEDPLGLF